jgi:hypothetical protein
MILTNSIFMKKFKKMILTYLKSKNTTNKDTIWIEVPKSHINPSARRQAIRETLNLLEQTLIVKQ